MRIKCDLNCHLLDLKEWLGYVLDIDSTASEVDGFATSSTGLYDITIIPALNLKTNIGEFRYGDISLQNLRTKVLTQKENHLYLDTADSAWWIPDIDLTAAGTTHEWYCSYVPGSTNGRGRSGKAQWRSAPWR
jgi:hypothetical protein